MRPPDRAAAPAYRGRRALQLEAEGPCLTASIECFDGYIRRGRASHSGPTAAGARETSLLSARAWLNNSTNARAANTFVPAAGNVGRDAYNSGDTRVGRGGDNIGHTRF